MVALVMIGMLSGVFACSEKSRPAAAPDAGGGGQAGSSGHGGAGGTAGATGGSDARQPGDGGPGDLSPDAAAATRAEQACRDSIIAQCERRKVCSGFSETDCAQYAADRCPDYYFGPHTHRTVENVEACVPLLRQASCTDYQMGIAPQCLLAGLGAAGDPCSGPAECEANWCSANFGSCGSCGKPLGLGESCGGGSSGCASGTLCDPTTRVCVATPVVVPHAAAGEPCDIAGDPPIGCEGDLMCVPDQSGDAGDKCTHLPEQGEPCLAMSSLRLCAPGLSCGLSTKGGEQTYRCGKPAPCGTDFCDANSFCYGSTADTLHCQPYVGSGMACSRASDSDQQCAPGLECVSATVFDDAGGVYEGTCVQQRNQVELGGACDPTSAFCRFPLVCQAGRCTRFDPATCYARGDAGL